MNALVCNTLLGAVTEYDNYYFHSVTPSHAGSATGLFAYGGDTDAGQPIPADVQFPRTLQTLARKKHLGNVYFSIKGAGSAVMTVYGANASWSYGFILRPPGETRCVPGKGIRENYLGIGLSTPDGQAWTLDLVEVDVLPSTNRRTS